MDERWVKEQPKFAEGLSAVERALFDPPEHLDGVKWFEAPVPRRWHRCTPQTRAWIGLFTRVERCACGAIRIDEGFWHNKNETRKAADRG